MLKHCANKWKCIDLFWKKKNVVFTCHVYKINNNIFYSGGGLCHGAQEIIKTN
jgi:hypothetical protein